MVSFRQCRPACSAHLILAHGVGHPGCCCMEVKTPHAGNGGRYENRSRLSSARQGPRGVPLCVRRGRKLHRKGDAYCSLSWEGIPSVLRAHRRGRPIYIGADAYMCVRASAFYSLCRGRSVRVPLWRQRIPARRLSKNFPAPHQLDIDLWTEFLGMGSVSNVDIDGNNTLQIKAIGAAISTFETLPSHPPLHPMASSMKVWPSPPRMHTAVSAIVVEMWHAPP